MSGISWGDYLFGFSGRINRGKYWLWILIYIVAAIVFGLVGALSGSGTVATILTVVFGIGALISGIAVAIKRLHDRDRSGWWLLVFFLLPGVLSGLSVGWALIGMAGGLAGGLTSDNPADMYGAVLRGGVGSMILSLLSFALAIWGFVEMACLRGTVGPNQYGPDPLEGRY